MYGRIDATLTEKKVTRATLNITSDKYMINFNPKNHATNVTNALTL